MPRVELVYDQDCPHVDTARRNIIEALSRAGVPIEWSETDRGAPGTPAILRRYGSPTVLVDDKDVAGINDADVASPAVKSCRVYQGEGGLSGAPPVELISKALRRARA